MEWTVVLALSVLTGLVAVIVKPMISLTRSLTKLTVLMDEMRIDIKDIVRKNSDSHTKLWDHNKIQDGLLQNHEVRITGLENKH